MYKITYQFYYLTSTLTSLIITTKKNANKELFKTIVVHQKPTPNLKGTNTRRALNPPSLLLLLEIRWLVRPQLRVQLLSLFLSNFR